MCGIAGFVESAETRTAFSPVESHSLIRRMCDVIRHRGPDDEGVFVDEGVALGMRRLSIIDLSTGHQPIHNEDRTVWIVFNGEIYNFRELRAELEQRGHRFKTGTDTEVIVHLYEDYGAGCVARLRGMFALAIWDGPRRQLFAARDRLGKKPFYWTKTATSLLFASEIKALLVDPGVSAEPDYAAIDDYLTYQYVPSPRTAFRNVQKLPAGHFGIATQGFPQLVRVNPHVIAADNSRAFPERSPVLCQVRMVNELPLIPDLERLEEMIADETTVTAA